LLTLKLAVAAVVPGTYEEKLSHIKELEQIVLLCVSGTTASYLL